MTTNIGSFDFTDDHPELSSFTEEETVPFVTNILKRARHIAFEGTDENSRGIYVFYEHLLAAMMEAAASDEHLSYMFKEIGLEILSVDEILGMID